jgi:hypothetical protein
MAHFVPVLLVPAPVVVRQRDLVRLHDVRLAAGPDAPVAVRVFFVELLLRDGPGRPRAHHHARRGLGHARQAALAVAVAGHGVLARAAFAVGSRRGAELAEQSPEDGYRGGDYGHCGLGCAPFDEVNTVP